MKQFVYVLKYLLKGRGNNLIQLLSITLGITVGVILLAQFSVKIHLGVGLLSFCGLCVLLLILITVVLKTIRTANENPVKSIKKE